MTSENTTVRVLGPVDQLPAEGFEISTESGKSILDFYVSALAESELGYELTERGIAPMRPAASGGVFQRFDLGIDPESDTPALEPGEEAYEIDFDVLFSDQSRWDELNDASEPQDYVRKFLETLGPALDNDSEVEFDGRHIPLIRWTPRENGDGAQVQLMGILQADNEQFEAFCRSGADDYNLILEDAEVEARGLREMAMILMVMGISSAAAPEAEAGFFKKLFAKHKEERAERKAQKQAVKKADARVQRSETGWVDSHNDARIDTALIEAAAGSNASRRVIVDIQKQRAYLVIDGRIAIDTAVSTARGDKHTPRGEFTITERIRSGKTSNLYGCSLPYWMRLDSSAIGLHIGDLPGHPASAGCIRLPFSVAPLMFDGTQSGTVVEVVDSWDGSAPADEPIMVAQAD